MSSLGGMGLSTPWGAGGLGPGTPPLSLWEGSRASQAARLPWQAPRAALQGPAALCSLCAVKDPEPRPDK